MQIFSANRPAVRRSFQKNSWGVASPPLHRWRAGRSSLLKFQKLIFYIINIKSTSVDFKIPVKYRHNIYLVRDHLWKGKKGRQTQSFVTPSTIRNQRIISASNCKSWSFYACAFFASMVIWVQWHVEIDFTKRGMDWTSNESIWEINI